MALSNFTELRDSVKDWLHRSQHANIDNIAADCIRMAESKFDRKLKSRMQGADTEITIDSDPVAIPSDVLAVLGIEVTSAEGTPRAKFEPAEILRARDDTFTGTPKKFSLQGNTLIFWPKPATAITATLYYRAKLTKLSGVATNWLLDDWPDLYLHQSIAQGGAWVRDSAQIAISKGLAEEAIAEINDFYMETVETEIEILASSGAVV